MLASSPTFVPRSHRTALPGWRVLSTRASALRDCSLVIPAADPDDVERLLDALLAIPDAPGEVVVVHAGPGRQPGARLRGWSARSEAPFDLVFVASPPGLTRQRNIGIDIATRDFLFFLDPSFEPLPGYFAVTRRVFDLDRDGCVGGVGGVVLNQSRRSLPRFGAGAQPLAYGRSAFSGLRRVDVLTGGASAWRREVFVDRRFSCYFGEWSEGEDVEFSLRAGKSWTLLCCGESRVKRLPGANSVPSGYHAARAGIRNRYFIWSRHTPSPDPPHEMRFWLAAALDTVTNLASFNAGHAAGIFAGIVSCVADPPRFVEPPARREYVLAAETLAAHTGD